jgi:cell wall-associated NlpC family hydrolase
MNPYFSNAENATRLVAEANSWIGTPWVHCAAEAGPTRAVKGVRGDCVHTIVAILEVVGAIPSQVLPAHNAHPGIASEVDMDETLAKFLGAKCAEGTLARVDPVVDELMIGDLITFRWASRSHHIGLYKGGANRMFWHAGGSGIGREFVLSSLNEGHYRRALCSAYRILDRGGDA